jgi:uncharacterized hydrophobic protein (TIGR00341 family)
MALRLIEIFHEGGKAGEIAHLLEEHPVIHSWYDELPGGETVSRVLTRAEDAEQMLNELQDCCGQGMKLHAVILPVEAAIPRPEEPKKEEGEEPEKKKSPKRLSIEELYQKVVKGASLSRGYLVMAGVASVIAAIGLMRNDVAVIIGSMVIAPLLGPNIGLILSITLADGELARRSLRTMLAGAAVVLGISVLIGLIFSFDPGGHELAARTQVRHSLIVLALATGVAGAYSITTGISEALVGVMVAVALLPPLAASGLYLGAGHGGEAASALLLFLVNVAGINLAGTATFLLQGVRPREWWEAKKATRAVRTALAVWILLLVLFAGLILLQQTFGLVPPDIDTIHPPGR